MSRHRLLLVAAPAAVLLAACGGPRVAAPPDMQYGLEECHHCRMIISEPRHAAALVTASGDVERFDDLGCLLARLPDLEPSPTAVWLHDADQDWHAAEDAVFVSAPGAATPMGYGFLAFAADDAEAARRLADETDGSVHDWRALRELAPQPSTLIRTSTMR